MMTPEMIAREIAQAFSTCRKFKRLTPQALAEQAGCDLAVVKRIESADFEACFALREKYSDTSSLERRLCDAIGLTPAMCIALDDGIIFQMGLFSFYLGYRKGRRRAERRAERDAWWADDAVDEDDCDNCGYRESQHSDEGLCPDYGN